MWSAANAGTGARCSMGWTKHDLEIGHEPDQIHPTPRGVPQTLAPAHGAVCGGSSPYRPCGEKGSEGRTSLGSMDPKRDAHEPNNRLPIPSSCEVPQGKC